MNPSPRQARHLILVLILAFFFSSIEWSLRVDSGWAQQPGGLAAPPQVPLFGAQGWMWFSQFANPALLGSLYLTPAWPKTGYYPLYPGSFSQDISEGGVLMGPLRLHPFMGVAEIYTDNVIRTNTNRKSDFATTLGPGIQARLPFAGFHTFVIDYRTNIQYYHRTSSNDVQDQTASGRFNFDFPGGLKLDLQGEHKLGHDPRGTALDTQALEVNKWTAESFKGQAQYDGAQAGARLNVQTIRWNFLNNNQGIIRDRLSNYAGLTFLGNATSKTSAVVNFGLNQETYDQNKNLDSTIYSVSGGPRWNVSDLTAGEVLVGYQYLKYSRARTDQPGPFLSRFQRDRDSAPNFFFAGNLDWKPTPLLTVHLQPYRTIQQTVVFGTLFFVATGANLAATHDLTESTALTLNVGVEQDRFTSPSGTFGPSGNRVDLIKNVAVGLRYRAVEWIGFGVQYAFEDRSSNVEQFSYYANTFMLSAQAVF